jgi:tetrahydromethanopterin S-methyltransferase subunit C
MSIRDKILNIVTIHPGLAPFVVGLVVTFVIGTIIGVLDIQHVLARPTDRFGGPL